MEFLNVEHRPVINDAGFHGIKFDFNCGARIVVPKNIDVRVKITDTGTDTVLCDVNTEEMLKQLPSDNTDDFINVSTDKTYYIEHLVEIWCGTEYWSHKLDLKDKPVLVKLGNGVIGDNLAWFGYVDAFQKKHQCKVYCKTDSRIANILDYPNITFIDWDDESIDTYASYYLGVYIPCSDRNHQPIDPRFTGIQRIAALELGLDDGIIKTVLKPTSDRSIKEKYVCIGVQSTTASKNWNNPFGWVNVVEYLKSIGYRVLCIDRDKVVTFGRFSTSIPYGCEDFTGDIPLQERINLLYYADFFIGVSSGLSWLAYCTGIPVIMISGFTLPLNEFPNPYRIINYNVCNGCWHYNDFDSSDYGYCPKHKGTDREHECSRGISASYVIKTIDKLIKDNSL